MKASLPASTVALCAAGVIVGCGGGSSHLTKAEFLKKANAICTKGNAQINAVAQQQFKTRPTTAQITTFARTTVIPATQSQIDQIRKLKPPAKDTSTVKAIVTAAQSDLAKVKANPTLLASNGQAQDPFAEANRLAKAYGMTACAGNNG